MATRSKSVAAAVQARVFAASPFVEDLWRHDPAQFARWQKSGWFDQPHRAGAVAAALRKAVATLSDEAEFGAALRRARREQMARIAWRALASLSTLDEALLAVSELADAACELALGCATAQLLPLHGEPRDSGGKPSRPIVLGMGKLGGRELNFSSDIDLLFAYSATGETAGPQVLANEQFFERLVGRFTRLLADSTADGFVFRVDWMLRPFGASGPPAMSVSAMEEYYQSHGREWERYALIKARVVAGDATAGAALLKALRPFVYRRYLDFNAIGALREMKRMIEGEVERRELHDNLKLGPGGIREIEFIAQAFQLMRGGQEPALQSTQLRPVLQHLAKVGYLPAASVRKLAEAYEHLRRVENAVQMHNDEQTHQWPAAKATRGALAAALGFRTAAALESKTAAVRKQVQSEFGRLFAEARTERSAATTAVDVIWAGVQPEIGRAELGKLGFGEDAGEVLDAVNGLREAPLVQTLSDTSQRRLPELLAAVLSGALAQRKPSLAAKRTLHVVTAVAGRSTYLTLLRENAGALEQLLRLCAASPWISDLLAKSPILLDQLLDSRALYDPPDRAGMVAELEQGLAVVPAADIEGAMDTLRRLQQELMLRIAAADLAGALPLVKVSDRLTWLAEAVVEKALERVHAVLVRQFGVACRKNGKPCGFGVIAYGKFGGIEMSYGSDLDLLFLHDDDNQQGMSSGGERSIANEMWLSRFAQRLIHWLSTQTSAGRAYDVDLELRPDGRRGLTVSSVKGFGSYQAKDAWTWEHQALTRARFVAGDPGIRRQFERIRRATLTAPRDYDKLRHDVVDMRRRMRENLNTSDADRFDLKQGAGGLTDIEFITQYLLLRHAAKCPEVLNWPDHWRQTEALAQAGVISNQDAEQLIRNYREYRAMLHVRALAQAPATTAAAKVRTVRKSVESLWAKYLGEAAGQ